jgi:hypothetical protein
MSFLCKMSQEKPSFMLQGMKHTILELILKHV